MISITCTQCRTVLTIDDAFAGGVCRCQHCGTIQTVPAHLKGTGGTSHAGPATHTTKTLYQNQSHAGAQGNGSAHAAPSGLDDLAGAVANSGLAGSGLGSRRLSNAAPTQAQPRRAPATQRGGQWQQSAVVDAPPQQQARRLPILPIAIAGGVVILLLVAAVAFLLFRGGGSTTSGTGGPGGAGGTSFAGVNLAGNSVAYLIDRGNSIGSAFDPAKAATYQSLASLGSDKKFAVILWNNGGEDIAYPPDGLRPATTDAVDACRKTLEDVVATGSSTLRSALEKAMARQPAVIVIVTSKSHLDEGDEQALSAAREASSGHTKFYAIVVGEGVDNPFLKLFTSSAGGAYKQISERDLRASVP